MADASMPITRSARPSVAKPATMPAKQKIEDKAAELLVSTSRRLDKAASKGVIHKNQAANKKSALAHALRKLGS